MLNEIRNNHKLFRTLKRKSNVGGVNSVTMSHAKLINQIYAIDKVISYFLHCWIVKLTFLAFIKGINSVIHYSVNIYLFKVNNRNIGKRCQICSKLTIKTIEWRQWRLSGSFIVNFGHISHVFLELLLLALNKWILAE